MGHWQLVFLAVVFAVASAGRLHDFRKSVLNEQNAANIWAVLVAGSNTWDNYRHQSDICRAYHILIDHGVPAKNIIVMAYDDIANNRQNPYPGKIYNENWGPDVYAGCVLDYKGSAVTPENFLAILKGDKSGVSGGNGRVVQSTSADNIFVFFSDHGSTGFIAFPDDILTASDLNTALESMHTKKSFGKLTFYLEACESGSMFYNVLKTNINVYAITAANEQESSWACYCDNDMYLPCLGDLFSVNWMIDSEGHDLTSETLQQQWQNVKTATTQSEVKHYGDLTIANNYVAAFQGWTTNSRSAARPTGVWPSRDIELLTLKKKIQQSGTLKVKQKLQSKVDAFEMKRQYLDNFMTDFVKGLVHDPLKQADVLSNHHEITQWQCHDKVIKAFHKSCFNFNLNPYALEYGFVLTNLCELEIPAERIVAEMGHKCSNILISTIH